MGDKRQIGEGSRNGVRPETVYSLVFLFCFAFFFFFSEGLGKGILRGKTAATKHRWGRFPGQMVAQVNEVLASSHNHIIITNKLGTMVIQNHLNSS